MSEAVSGCDEKTMAFGLLMESAQAHQKSAEHQLQRLRDHTRDLDGVVREEIRRTLVDELHLLSQETAQAVGTLQKLQRSVMLRGLLANLVTALLCSSIPVVVAKLVLPSAADVASLAARRDELVRNVAGLKQQGGAIDLRRCGAQLRLCVRVDPKAPKFGERADYLIVEGY